MVDPVDLKIAAEFFELFKTPWEPAIPGRKYDLVLSTGGCLDNIDGQLFVIYGSAEQAVDRAAGVAVTPMKGPITVEWGEFAFPIYGRTAGFGTDAGELGLVTQGRALDCRLRVGGRTIHRVGYDVFNEIRYLLTTGQPAAYALTPTLEMHVALVRRCLIDSRAPFLEILPRPAGHQFICCLTHDVDFYGIRRHKFDRTLAGFMLRASFGTITGLLRGNRSLAEAKRNLRALCSLPLVFIGWVPDFWRPFEDYSVVEDGRRSTFFLIPFGGRPGLSPDETINRWRAAPYAVSEIREDVKQAADRGSELAVHGIDAWRDAQAGREEMGALSAVTGQQPAGIRMHWLYFEEDSPNRLDAAGFQYDSTWGYNDTVGYRAGTSQVFRPIGSETLLELPLSIMDSALFSSGRMGLGHEEALRLCRRILDNARRFGGTLVVNWHERSLAPERLWGRFYRELLQEIRRGDQAWFATAREAVSWFRWRRSIRFLERESVDGILVQAPTHDSSIPGAVIRVYRPSTRGIEVEDGPFDGSAVFKCCETVS